MDGDGHSEAYKCRSFSHLNLSEGIYAEKAPIARQAKHMPTGGKAKCYWLSGSCQGCIDGYAHPAFLIIDSKYCDLDSASLHVNTIRYVILFAPQIQP